MKAILGVLVVAALGVVAWVLFSGVSETPEAVPQSSEATEDAAEEKAEEATEAVDDAKDEATEAVEKVEDTVDDLKDQAETAVEEVKTEVDEAVSDAEEQVDQAADAIKQQAEDAVEQGSETVKSAVENALGGLTGGGGASDDTNEESTNSEADETANLEHDADKPVEPSVLDQALSVETFDGLAIREALATSELDDLTKTAVESLVTMGEQNPDQLQDVIEKIRGLFGI